MLIHNSDLKIIVTHAGLPPQWSLTQAQSLACEVEEALHGVEFKSVLAALEGDEPYAWRDDLKGADRNRYIVNALTRMRFCDYNGRLDFKEKDVIKSSQPQLKPWFEWPNHLGEYRLFFGHWAALNGTTSKDNSIATDTGCVYGKSLTAYQVQDSGSMLACFSVPYQESN